jgi:hypothetical protein
MPHVRHRVTRVERKRAFERRFRRHEIALVVVDQPQRRVCLGKVGRKLDTGGKEVGIYKRIEVKVPPLVKGEPVNAITYQGTNVEKYHIPPTQHYMDLVIQGAYSFGLSMMWISYLQSFSTQVGRKPRAPGTGDAASRL